MKKLSKLVDKTKKPLFICIGTSKSYYDNTANRIGAILKENYVVIDDINSFNMEEKVKLIDTYDKSEYQHIAIDLSYDSKFEERKKQRPYHVSNTPITPGSALGKAHTPLGDISIHVTLNYFEDISDALDMIMAISKQKGNKDILRFEKKICNMINKIYKGEC